MVYPEKCTGCGTCELACSIAHEGEFRPSASRVGVLRLDEGGRNVPVMCFQCEDAPCGKACRPGALRRDETSGVVRFDAEKCVGCGLCVKACAYGSISCDRAEKRISKCDHCGGTPQCVAYCPAKALDFPAEEGETLNEKRAFMATIAKTLAEAR